MPLVIMCGLPSSGKSERAKELHDFLLSSSKHSVLIQDENVMSPLSRNQLYSDAQKEKDFRSSLKSFAERNLSKETTVVLDAGNYIKGFRYELYCLSKSVKTTCCVIQCDLLPSDCWEYNESRDETVQYSREVFDALVLRFEEPDSRNRWDSPLFIVHKDEDQPCQAISDAIYLRKPPPPNLSTQCAPLASTNFLYDLDRITQEVIKCIQEAQKTNEIGEEIIVPKAEEKLELPRALSMGDLNRLRRQFVSYTRSHPIYDSSKIPNLFVQYINRSI